MSKEIYGWHIIHIATGMPYAFCSRGQGATELSEADALDGLPVGEFVLIPLVRADSIQ
ncbi:hypothetical protein H0A71_05900 [Alcaligenaceae bacterium]|nr:hypothetical protein [Alcaligenaceae bacterium]